MLKLRLRLHCSHRTQSISTTNGITSGRLRLRVAPDAFLAPCSPSSPTSEPQPAVNVVEDAGSSTTAAAMVAESGVGGSSGTGTGRLRWDFWLIHELAVDTVIQSPVMKGLGEAGISLPGVPRVTVVPGLSGLLR